MEDDEQWRTWTVTCVNLSDYSVVSTKEGMKWYLMRRRILGWSWNRKWSSNATWGVQRRWPAARAFLSKKSWENEEIKRKERDVCIYTYESKGLKIKEKWEVVEYSCSQVRASTVTNTRRAQLWHAYISWKEKKIKEKEIQRSRQHFQYYQDLGG